MRKDLSESGEKIRERIKETCVYFISCDMGELT